jgi:hypothetical protein
VPRGELAVIRDLTAAINVGSWRAVTARGRTASDIRYVRCRDFGACEAMRAYRLDMCAYPACWGPFLVEGFRLDFLRDSGDSRCGWSRLYSLLRSMVSAVLQGPPCPGVRAHVVFFRGIHLPHHSCPI